jgi:hypothetical protein
LAFILLPSMVKDISFFSINVPERQKVQMSKFKCQMNAKFQNSVTQPFQG